MNEYAAEVDRINGNVASTYTALSEMGATMPAQQNSDNLPETVRTVPQGVSKTVQTDWNQTDETAPDFLKNKPFGDIHVVVVEEQEVTFHEDMGYSVIPNNPIQDGDNLTVVYDGTTYNCLAQIITFIGAPGFGNFALIDPGFENTGEPFCGVFMEGMIGLLLEDQANHTFEIIATRIEKIPGKYVTTYTEFYTLNDGEYLYTDAVCQNKATKNDVMTAAKKGTIRLVHTISSIPISTTQVLMAPISEQSNFFVIACDLKGSETREFRTAEYVPETTT